jgi:UDP-N-acetylglucosamine 4,6-dehydratase
MSLLSIEDHKRSKASASMTKILAGKTVLVTGGTGSFGTEFVGRLLAAPIAPKKIIIFSRDEWKQHVSRQRFNDDHRLRYFLGDVRDVERLRMAFRGVDVVIHSAALKHIDACEYNPEEAVRTNTLGAINVVRAALDCGVSRVVALSTDKAAAPLNVYGASKLCAEIIFRAANAYDTAPACRFVSTRYGNVSGSRGSVIPKWVEALRKDGFLSITNPDMTRFWMTLPETVDLVLMALNAGRGGEVFLPRLRAYRLGDLASAVLLACDIGNVAELVTVTGHRAGEKVHESLVGEDESRMVEDHGSHLRLVAHGADPKKLVPEGWVYRSDTVERIGLDELTGLVRKVVRTGDSEVF